MPIAFACPSCQANINVSDAAAGRRGKCPQCKGPIVVPSPGPAASSTEPAPSLAPVENEPATAGGRGSHMKWALWAALFGMVFGVCVGVVSTIMVSSWLSASSPQAAATGKGDQDAKDREAVIAFIKTHADDPSDLEILEWGPKREEEGANYFRNVRFRCKRIAGTASADKARVTFSEGKVVNMEFDGVMSGHGRIWYWR